MENEFHKLSIRIEELTQEAKLSESSREFFFLLHQMDNIASNGSLLLCTLAVEATQNAHICLKLNAQQIKRTYAEIVEGYSEADIKSWFTELSSTKLVSTGQTTPFILESDRLYLQRFWVYENFISSWINQKSGFTDHMDEEFEQILDRFIDTNKSNNEGQDFAIAMALIKKLLFITGGPGTGKTFTVLKILSALTLSDDLKEARIAVCAPTGKAAQRLFDSLKAGIQKQKDTINLANVLPEEAQTVHKLLGSDRFGSTFRFNKENKLPLDIIVIDEASMLDVHMWFNLLSAVHEDTRLILLGDKDQLSSVEAGSIMGDICTGKEGFSKDTVQLFSKKLNLPVSAESRNQVQDCVIFLDRSYRFSEDSGIKLLSDSINSGDAENAMHYLEDQKFSDINFMTISNERMEDVLQVFGVAHYDKYVKEKDRFDLSKQKKILCAIRKGFQGVEHINRSIEHRIKKIQGVSEHQLWYDGRLILSTRNDEGLGIRNGELGICSRNEQAFVAFENDPERLIPVQRMQSYEPAFAITIHKSQGSEFDDVLIVLPEKARSGFISKELLYTSVTRARKSVLIIGSKEVFKKAISNKVNRNSGLKEKL